MILYYYFLFFIVFVYICLHTWRKWAFNLNYFPEKNKETYLLISKTLPKVLHKTIEKNTAHEKLNKKCQQIFFFLMETCISRNGLNFCIFISLKKKNYSLLFDERLGHCTPYIEDHKFMLKWLLWNFNFFFFAYKSKFSLYDFNLNSLRCFCLNCNHMNFFFHIFILLSPRI